MQKILVIDDDRDTCDFLQELLMAEGCTVETAQTARRGLELACSGEFDCIVADINLNDKLTGLDLLRALKQTGPSVKMILITAFGTLDMAIEAIREGAFDFISKPFNVQQVIATVRRALGQARPALPSEDVAMILRLSESSGLIGRAPKMIELYKEVARVAPTRLTVLLTGESGTGKELIARAIHRHSSRAHRPFIAVNCGALTETLLESELFGHVKGSFTGAVSDKRGLFEEAHQGTIFLDEISETSPGLQVKLLRVLQEGEIKRVGDSRSRTVDVRVIAASNRRLDEEVAAGRFREDLYYRLSAVTLTLPPLRERREDIPLLAMYFLKRLEQQAQGDRVPPGGFALMPDALDLLLAYTWPGNVRELENAIEYAALHARSGIITSEDFPEKIRAAVTHSPREADRAPLAHLFLDLPSLEELERRYLLHVLETVNWNRSRAAEILGIDRRTLYRMAERFGLSMDKSDTT
ncbi:MAG TPA: sigma-54 dependent transcriptional regulator [Blastocatellia bacterium]|nr:sigma-54 dependent transcriptional regulator [Blastocatellia bacterium]